jgi:ABC-2 type transport system permease protein
MTLQSHINKYWFIFTYYHKLETRYFWTNLFYFVGLSIGIYTNFWVWQINQKDSNILQELILAAVFFALSNSTIYWHIGRSVESGSMSKDLLTPTNLFTKYFLTNLGWLPSTSFYYFISLLPLILISNIQLSWNLLFVPFLIIAGFLIRFLIGIAIGLSAFWSTQTYGQVVFYQSFLPLLIGALIPVRFFPDWFQQVLIYSPFSWIIHHPMQIYKGLYNWNQILLFCLIGIFWLILLFVLARKVLQFGLKRNEAVGL